MLLLHDVVVLLLMCRVSIIQILPRVVFQNDRKIEKRKKTASWWRRTARRAASRKRTKNLKTSFGFSSLFL
jgi:hypothetical protein